MHRLNSLNAHLERLNRWSRTGGLMALGLTTMALAQPALTPREFPPGTLRGLGQLPASRLKLQLDQLPPTAQERALRWLRSFHFTEQDLASLHADPDGGIFYICNASPTQDGEPDASSTPPVAWASVPVSPFPARLIFHSRPGAPNVLYLNFAGETVLNTEWNTYVERAEIPALPFSTDSDYAAYSDAEQLAIKRIWQRVAEDYAPFNIDVTTERPPTFGTRTAHALITRNMDANGEPNPASSSGGVAYVNVFGTSSYAKYRPAWVYHNNLANDESYTSESASHEIGHNLGLSHDGRTDGSEYYGGHGSGDISWGPLMGTGYNRNVSHWCKGEYYLANNTQDDLATIAGKISYRTDDHGDTAGTATALLISSGTNVVSTTPENDPTNVNPANKGVLQRTTDRDIFSFVTGSGPVRFTVNPWIMPSGTRGGNVDLLLELYNEAGTLLLTSNPTSQTTALLQTDLPEGRYYLHVRNSGAGDPLSSTPTGYTIYSSLGQYFISGYVTEATSVIVPPVAELRISDLLETGQASQPFTVTYSDDVGVDVSTADSTDIRVTGPNGYDRAARFVSLDVASDGTPRTATYAADPPAGGAWSTADNGTYTVWMQTEQVSDIAGAWVAAGQLGQFNVAVPSALYSANMDLDPGWTLEPQWQYGTPSYGGAGPTSGYTGTQIIGYNLSGNYANNLPAKYATTPTIDTSGSTTLTLRFQRWLRTRNNDTVSIQVSTNGTSWINVWSSSSAIADTFWREVQHPLPAVVAGSPSVRLRWGLASSQAQNDIGWNLDDVVLLGDGSLDTTPPVPSLRVAQITSGGSPSHACSVTYTDDTAVRLSSLDALDLIVTGPHGYSNVVEFIGADLPSDGSPMTATYSIPAPGDTWDEADNGTYDLVLVENEVQDTLNNATPRTALGSFSVSISTPNPGALEVTPADGLAAAGTVGGPFSPSSITYTLTNAGSLTLNWTASQAQNWVSLSATSGTLAPGASTATTVSINTLADSLTAGSHSNTVSFVNTTTANGNTIRTLTLTVNAPGQLDVSPDSGLSASGMVGGPFSPSSITYTLANTGGSSLDWTASKSQNWVDLSATRGTLAAGASTTVTVLINANADSLNAGTYSGTVTLVGNTTESAPHLLPMTLQVATPPQFTMCSLTAPGVFQMVVEATPGMEVIIEASADLTAWTAIYTNQAAAEGSVTLSDPASAELPKRWYRARAEP